MNERSHDSTPAVLIRLPRGERPRLFLSVQNGAEEAELQPLLERISRALGLSAQPRQKRERSPRLRPYRRPA